MATASNKEPVLIKADKNAKNWIVADERDGYVSMRRVNETGEVLQSFLVFPDEAKQLAEMLNRSAA